MTGRSEDIWGRVGRWFDDSGEGRSEAPTLEGLADPEQGTAAATQEIEVTDPDAQKTESVAALDIQEMLQAQQQTIATLSNVSKVLHDTSLAIIRKIASNDPDAPDLVNRSGLHPPDVTVGLPPTEEDPAMPSHEDYLQPQLDAQGNPVIDENSEPVMVVDPEAYEAALEDSMARTENRQGDMSSDAAPGNRLSPDDVFGEPAAVAGETEAISGPMPVDETITAQQSLSDSLAETSEEMHDTATDVIRKMAASDDPEAPDVVGTSGLEPSGAAVSPPREADESGPKPDATQTGVQVETADTEQRQAPQTDFATVMQEGSEGESASQSASTAADFVPGGSVGSEASLTTDPLNAGTGGDGMPDAGDPAPLGAADTMEGEIARAEAGALDPPARSREAAASIEGDTEETGERRDAPVTRPEETGTAAGGRESLLGVGDDLLPSQPAPEDGAFDQPALERGPMTLEEAMEANAPDLQPAGDTDVTSAPAGETYEIPSRILAFDTEPADGLEDLVTTDEPDETDDADALDD
jgi:hypothetical protein